jgi:chemotaxis protein MotB
MVENAPRRRLLAGLAILPLAAAGCVSQSKFDAVQAENAQLRQQLAAQTARANAEAQQISRLQNAIAHTINSDLLFQPGSWRLSQAGERIMGDFARQLGPTQQSRLLVTGYTDSAPVGPALQREGIANNQQLSQKRAESVMQFLVAQGARPDMITARGRGEADPVAPNTTAQGRARNRRVVISVG